MLLLMAFTRMELGFSSSGYLLHASFDDNFNISSYYYCSLSVIYKIPSITISELLDAAPAINYANLPLTFHGNFGNNAQSLVEGEDSRFRKSGLYYYADAHKINLNENESLEIHNSHVVDAFLYVYQRMLKILRSIIQQR